MSIGGSSNLAIRYENQIKVFDKSVISESTLYISNNNKKTPKSTTEAGYGEWYKLPFHMRIIRMRMGTHTHIRTHSNRVESVPYDGFKSINMFAYTTIHV